MTTVETRIRIERQVEEVFAYASDPSNLPRWNSAVTAVSPSSDGASYVLERTLPGGRAENRLEIVAHETPSRLALRTTSGPTPFAYELRFTPLDGATVIDVEVKAELGRVASLLGPLAQSALARGVNDNLATLKAILDRPRPPAARP